MRIKRQSILVKSKGGTPKYSLRMLVVHIDDDLDTLRDDLKRQYP